MLNKNNNSDAIISLTKQDRIYSPTVDSMMEDILLTLGSIDLQHDAELEKLEKSRTDEELKKYIKGKLLVKHRERREPYVELLAELRKHQYRPAFVS